MTEYNEQRCDRIAVNFYPPDDDLPTIDFTIDGEDRGGWPPYYFSFMHVRRDDLPNGEFEVGFKQIIGRDLYYGPMSEKDLNIIANHFDFILETDGERYS